MRIPFCPQCGLSHEVTLLPSILDVESYACPTTQGGVYIGKLAIGRLRIEAKRENFRKWCEAYPELAASMKQKCETLPPTGPSMIAKRDATPIDNRYPKYDPVDVLSQPAVPVNEARKAEGLPNIGEPYFPPKDNRTTEQRVQDALEEGITIEHAQLESQKAIRGAVTPKVNIPTETVVNEKGAKQSAVAYRMDLLPPLATLAVAAVLDEGSKKYGDDNWRGIPLRENINHALIHLLAYLAGDKQEPHLDHAACRTLFALELSKCNP